MFGSLFGKKNEEKHLNWKRLTEASQLDEIMDLSVAKPIVIFKHSTRCGISRMVLNQFEANADFNEDSVDLYYLDLLNYRSISNEISERFHVLHQSPQMLILSKGSVVHHSSHSEIVPSTINSILDAN
jgi:bacillithiol system protein YtxJ